MKNYYLPLKGTFMAFLLCGSLVSHGQFSGSYAPSNWVTSAPVGGTINSAGAPANVVLTGPNSSLAGNLDYSITIPSCQGVYLSFNWSVTHPDPGYDNMYYGVNGVYTFLTDASASGVVGPLTLNQGTVLTFRINSEDGAFGAPTFTISNLTYTTFDITAPVPDVALLPDVLSDCSLTLTTPTATDNCAGALTATTTDPTFYDVIGTYSVTWSFDDGSGNIVTQAQNVEIAADVTAPVPDVASLSDVSSLCEANVTAPTATDGCSGMLTATTTDPMVYTMPGNYVITWVYEDGAGNSASQTQNVEVIADVDAPVPNAVSLPDLTGDCGVILTAPSATDNCSGNLTGLLSLPVSMEGSFVITWIFDDGNGNTSTQDQNITINNPLIITAAVEHTISGTDGAIDLTVTGGAAPLTFDWEHGATTEDVTGLAPGMYTVRVTDADGCELEETFLVSSQLGTAESTLEFNLYPNPTTGVVRIEVPYTTSDEAVVLVYNAMGQIVQRTFLNAQQVTLDLNALPNGIYLVEINDNNSRIIQKLIKE